MAIRCGKIKEQIQKKIDEKACQKQLNDNSMVINLYFHLTIIIILPILFKGVLLIFVFSSFAPVFHKIKIPFLSRFHLTLSILFPFSLMFPLLELALKLKDNPEIFKFFFMEKITIKIG